MNVTLKKQFAFLIEIVVKELLLLRCFLSVTEKLQSKPIRKTEVLGSKRRMDITPRAKRPLPMLALGFFMTLFLPLSITAGSHGSDVGNSEDEHEVKIGVLLPMTGYWPIGKTSASAITIAVDRINRDPSLLPGYKMTFLWNDSMCLAAEGLNQAVEFHISGVDAIIGDGCDIICEPAAILAASWNLPMVSWGCESSKLSEKSIFQTFARTVGSFSKMGDLFLSVFHYFKWKRIGILASTESIWQLAMTGLMKVFLQNDIDIRYLRTLSPGHVLVTEREEFKSMLSLARENARSK